MASSGFGRTHAGQDSNVVALSDCAKRTASVSPALGVNQHTNAVHALRPFRHLLTGNVLEVGGDDGQLPCFLAETATRVTVLRQDTATLQRVLASCSGIGRVLAATKSLITSLGRQQFDAVVIMDLPTSAWRSCGDEASGKVAAILARARSHLKPGGVLIAAIDNRFALRHFAGHGEVAQSHCLFSLEGLPRPDGFVLPGRRELQGTLCDLGLQHQDWWFPFPDHRSPLTLIAEKGLDAVTGLDVAALVAPTLSFDPRRSAYTTFSMQRALAAMAKGGLLADLANAFVVACCDRPFQTQDALALHYGHARRAIFEKEVRFEKVGETIQVQRQPLYGSGIRTFDGVSNRFPNERLEAGCYWPASLQHILAHPHWTTADLTEWALVWQQAVITTYGLLQAPSLSTILPGGAVDAIPRNLIVGSNGSAFVDAEWDFGGPIEFGWLLVRGLIEVFQQSVDCASPVEGTSIRIIDLVTDIAAALGHALGREQFQAYFACESRLQTAVTGKLIEVSLDTFADVRLHLRSDSSERLALVEEELVSRAAAYNVLRAEHDDLRLQLDRTETELLHSRFRMDRELRELRAEREALSEIRAQLESEIVRLKHGIEPVNAEQHRRFGGLFQRAGRSA